MDEFYCSTSGVVPLVKEFYTNVNDRSQSSFVRGLMVKYGEDRIISHYGLKSARGDAC